MKSKGYTKYPDWVKAGGKVVKGLTNRRADEKRICLEGLA